MKTKTTFILTPLLTLTLLAGCGGDDGPTDIVEPPMEDPPTVESIVPGSGTSDLGLLQDFRVSFSEAMDSSTLDASTVSMTPADGELRQIYDDETDELWIVPADPLPPDTDLTLAISDGAMDLEGESLDPFSVSFSTGPMSCENLADRMEPNPDPESATEVMLDTPILALSTCEDDEDFFRFTVDERTQVTARTTFHEADEDSWGMYWERENGDRYSTLGIFARADDDAASSYTFEPGSYFLRLFGFDEEPAIVYDLVLETGAPCEDDVHEDNDFQDQAAAVDPGILEGLRGCRVDADWYSVPVEAGQTIRLTLDPGEYNGITRLRIREPGGSQEQVNGNGETMAEQGVTADGTAHVMSQVWNDDVIYDLTIDLID